MITQQLYDIMSQTINCRYCWDSEFILKEPFVPPRGWAGGTDKNKVKLVVVTLNPGHPMESEIKQFSKVSMSEKLGQYEIDYLYNFATDTFTNPQIRGNGRDTVFHSKMKNYMVEALVYCGLVDRKEAFNNWLDYVWLTDLFKCSTKSETGPNIPLNNRIRCQKYLLQEINYFNPKAIIAMHGKARDDLSKISIIKNKLVYFRHPSNGGPTVNSPTFKQQLDKLKSIIDRQ